MHEAISDFFYKHCDKQKIIDQLHSVTGEQEEENKLRFLRIWAQGDLKDAGLKYPEVAKLWLRDRESKHGMFEPPKGTPLKK